MHGVASIQISILCSFVCSCSIQGSWRLSLRSAFKNFRRDYPRNENLPPSKKKRISEEDITDETTEEEYEEAIKELQAEHAKGKKGGKNHSKIKELMEQTHTKRQKWICDTNPLIADVVELFPALSTSKGVSLCIQLCIIYATL